MSLGETHFAQIGVEVGSHLHGRRNCHCGEIMVFKARLERGGHRDKLPELVLLWLLSTSDQSERVFELSTVSYFLST